MKNLKYSITHVSSYFVCIPNVIKIVLIVSVNVISGQISEQINFDIYNIGVKYDLLYANVFFLDLDFSHDDQPATAG